MILYAAPNSGTNVSLIAQVEADLLQALRDRDSLRTSVFRLLKAELHNAKIGAGGVLSAEEEQRIVRREAKKRRETAELYATSGHADRSQVELAEAAILEGYLPAAPSETEIEVVAKQILSTLDTSAPAARGQLIRGLIDHFAGRLDGSTASQVAARLLTLNT